MEAKRTHDTLTDYCNLLTEVKDTAAVHSARIPDVPRLASQRNTALAISKQACREPWSQMTARGFSRAKII